MLYTKGNTSNDRNRHHPGAGAQNIILKPEKITFGILNGIDMMGNDIDMNQTFASPTFRVAEMQIGGK